MPAIKISIKNEVHLPPFNMTASAQNNIGQAAKKSLLVRTSQGMDANDSAMQPYSTKRIYIPIVPYTGAHAKAGLKITNRKIQELKKQGLVITDARKYKVGRSIRKTGIIRNRKTISYPNYAAYKVSLGYPSYRNLKLRGKMLGAIMIQSGPRSVNLYIASGIQANKARGNSRYADWFRLSPRNAVAIGKVMQEELNKFYGAK